MVWHPSLRSKCIVFIASRASTLHSSLRARANHTWPKQSPRNAKAPSFLYLLPICCRNGSVRVRRVSSVCLNWLVSDSPVSCSSTKSMPCVASVMTPSPNHLDVSKPSFSCKCKVRFSSVVYGDHWDEHVVVGVGTNNVGVLVLAATNIPWALDTAIRRR